MWASGDGLPPHPPQHKLTISAQQIYPQLFKVSAVVTKIYIKLMAKVSLVTLSSWEASVKKKVTENSWQCPWVRPGVLPWTLGHLLWRATLVQLPKRVSFD